MEDYAAKMALKPDAALREYVAGHAQYREEAVLAALDELRRRGQAAPEEAALRSQLEATVQQQAAAQADQARQLATPLPDEEVPVLYTPGAIVLFSVLFNTILAGAVLLALNLRRLKQTQALWRLIGFVIAYLIAEAVIVNKLIPQYSLNRLVLSLLNLPAILVYVLWFWPRYVGKSQFQPRSWLVPLLVCFVLMMLLGLVALYLLPHLPGGEQLLKQIQQQQ